jgi:hypothetical protein
MRALLGLTDRESHPLAVTRGNRHGAESRVATGGALAATSVLGLGLAGRFHVLEVFYCFVL